jgi:phosphate uptake regulator
MQKKLTAQGPKNRKSYTVTLPIEWVKEQRLDKTRSVDMEIVGNKIVFSANAKRQECIVILEKEYKHTLVKVLQGLYRLGISEIKIMCQADAYRRSVTEIIEQRLIGCEIVEQKPEYILVQDITTESKEDFQVILRRIFLLLLEYREAKDLTQAQSLDRSIKKFCNYSQRTLMKQGHSEYNKVPIYYLLIDRMEKLSDEILWFFQSKSQNVLVHKVYDLLRNAYDVYYKFSNERCDTFSTASFDFKNSIKEKKNIDIPLMHLHNIARIINSMYGDIYVLRFDGD